MKKTLLWLVAGPLALLLLLVVLVNVLALSGEAPPPPDPALVIELPGGARQPLGELLQAWSAPTEDADPAPTAALAPSDTASRDTASRADARPAEAAFDAADLLERIERSREEFLRQGPPPGDLFQLAEWHRAKGSHEQAAALYASVPRGHRSYARAQRRLGWDCYTRGDDEPARAVRHVHNSLAADPLDGNGWQDAARVYAATLGLPVD